MAVQFVGKARQSLRSEARAKGKGRAGGERDVWETGRRHTLD